MATKLVPSVGRQTFIDGHNLNESYKQPSATGKENLTYMHPHVKPISIEAPWKTADKALSEAHRPPAQLSRSKTVAPVSTGKVRGAPRQPAPGAIPGPAKPTVF